MTGSLSESGLGERSPATFPSPLSEICTVIAMAILFFAVVTPLGVVMRLTGRDRLRLRFEPAEPSYWVPRPPHRRASIARPV
jgi:hypothetical protein